MYLLILIIFCFSIGFGRETDLILVGNVSDNPSNRNPAANYDIRAYKVEDYLFHNTLDTSSVTGVGKSDSNGFFMIAMSGFTPLTNEDSVCIVLEGFDHCGSVRDFRYWIHIYTDEEQVALSQWGGGVRSQSIHKGDTIEVEAGKTAGKYIFDPLIAPAANFHEYGNFTEDLPHWVTVDECTSWVCIRIEAPEETGITECRLNMNIGDSLSYTLNFYVNVLQSLNIDNMKTHNTYGVKYLIKENCILANFQISKPEMLEAYIVNANGRVTGSRIIQSYPTGSHAITFLKPSIPGLYFLKVTGNLANISVPIYIRK